MEDNCVPEIEPKGSIRRGSRGVWTLPSLAFCGVAFLLTAYLCQTAQLVRVEYEVLAKREHIKVLEAAKADLELSVQELTSLERVERVAIGRLQMVAPTERHVIEVVWSKALPKGSEMAAATP